MTVVASMLAGLVAYVVDRLLGLAALTAHGGAAGSLLRLLVLGLIMLPIVATVMVRAQVPEAVAAMAAVRRRIGRRRRQPARGAGSRPAAIAQGSSHRRPCHVP